MKKVSMVLTLVLLGGGLFCLAAQDKVDLNKATEQSLQSLPGIGPALARRIVEHRDKNGPFRKVEDLMNVRGIGSKKFESLEKYLMLTPVASASGSSGKKAKNARPPLLLE